MDTQTPDPQTLQPAFFVDSDHALVKAFSHTHAIGQTQRERAVALFYAVRDGFRYDPYQIDLAPTGMKASSVLLAGHGWCANKATLLAAACRAAGIAARLGFADVRNHLSTERLRRTMQTDVFAWHGYTDIWLDGAWRKATPAFNLSLCDKFGLLPLDFDGRSDSIYHAFDKSGQRHMEYVRQRGTFHDLPLAHMLAAFKELYPPLETLNGRSQALGAADFLADVEREAQANS